ncbi:MAG: hypothetical protein LBS48_04325 [Treponema sp.]|jgi:hypothetical protein|nr:hypothetical protein [Treponema sp.]
MKQRVFFTAALCCVLLFTGFNAAAQETSPLPPPEQGTATVPAPDTGAVSQPVPARPREQAPAQSSGRTARTQTPAAGRTGSGGDAPRVAESREQTPAPTAARQEQAAPAAGIPSTGMFWGAMAGFNKNNYSKYDSYDSSKYKGETGFNGGILLGYDFGLLAAQAEVLFTTESLEREYYKNYYDYYEDWYGGKGIRVPLMLKLDFHLGRIMLHPQAGVFLNLTLGDLEHKDAYYDVRENIEYSNPVFGMMFGGALGFRIGRGYLFADTRYAVNLGYTEVEGDKTVRRSGVMVNFGYQYYFKSKQ